MVGHFLFFLFFLSASLSHLLDLSHSDFFFFLAVIWLWIRQWWVQMVMGGSVMVASDGRPVGSFRWLGRLLFMLMSMQYKCRPFLLISQKISASLQQSSTIGPSITSPHPEGPEPLAGPKPLPTPASRPHHPRLSKIPICFSLGLNLLAVVDDDSQ